MTIEPLKNSKKEDLTNFIEINEKEMNCKDGYCFLPNQNDNQKITTDNTNIFDPI